LFNEFEDNRGFQEYVGKKVRITGYLGKGYRGWQFIEVEGIHVENIEKLGWFG